MDKFPDFSSMSGFLNEEFACTGSATGGPVPASFRLIEAKNVVDDEISHSYSLLFWAPGPRREQQMYTLNHRSGVCDYFLVPIQKKDGGIIYEAAFSLLKEAALQNSL